ncbi:MAG TPA: CPBP family intramembrane metalloprotease [Spirochaetota bacterium]|nr:CPBP family intramembrane metalloprotease [Spirochaetota bacterium]HOS33361.1 CPBP family intramembrane metalloprotease [Spirochaetota bacterium]HOS56162.1 CPBP family intramembrane metalloprotease [Spirochaetota bacterium]HQF78583.1 CPBP family intramembrane metalloprotease [Spirochaetota bacterium]HQH29849.1 CPBP family intramembrane metalloprotease [Spirochaetota bacterium]
MIMSFGAKKNTVLSSIIFIYLSLSIIFVLPIIIYILFFPGKEVVFLTPLAATFNFNFNIPSLVFLTVSISLVMVIDIIFIQDSENLKKNRIINEVFPDETKLYSKFIVSFLSGFFEEIFFRGYLFYLPSLFLGELFYNKAVYIVVIVLISVIFGILHITQGKTAAALSGAVSIIFFISIKLSSSIWLPIIYHFLFNFIQLSVVLPYNRKKSRVSI